jgi:subtilisin family serine protease
MPRRVVFAWWLALALAGLVPGVADASGKVAPAAMAQAEQAGAARVLVVLHDRFDPGTPESGRAAKVRTDVDAVLAALPARGNAVMRRFRLVPALALRADAATLARLRDHPAVRRVDLDAGGAATAIPADAASTLNRVDRLVELGLDGRGQKVAVVDSGVDTDHPDLGARLVAQQCFCSSDTGGCCPNGQATQGGAGAAEDDHGHGTNVSGIIVGEGLVAPRGAVPRASLVAVKVLDRNGRYCCSSDVVAALDWLAAEHPDVDVVNLSLGTSALFTGDCDAGTAYNQALSMALGRLRALGAVVTVSSGNQGSSTSMASPACLRDALSVGATWDFAGGPLTFLGCSETGTAPMQPTCFSNRSATTDLYAAGAYVTSAGRTGATSTYGGTSQAAPMVAGCAAALAQAAPLSTPQQRIDALTLSPATVRDAVSGRQYPFLECRDALRLLAPAVFEPILLEGSHPLVPPKLQGAPGAANATPATKGRRGGAAGGRRR